METPFTSGAFKPEAAFASAAEHFFELLKTFGMPSAGATGAGRDWSSLAGPLAGQFEAWLKTSQSAGPWFAAANAASPGLAAFGPLPLGAGAAPQQDAQRTWDLVARLAQLQGQLAAHWSEIASTAARRFIARLGAAAGGAPTLDNALKFYELWVNCAEESYAATVRKDDFSRLQAELANTSAALLVEQRRHAETLVRAFGLPTRNEVDALYAQLKDLRRQLAELTDAPRAKGAGAKRPAARPAGDKRRARRRKPRA
ncbi:MAG TPA: poly(R)-hydroxyalkanoic acid synthase subunit PhaE [Steroidobacteraceae bacterium]|nr:poly(R)-hydroxyalkanoic acid synthase subunit PhaE [Steroidobacteraceae bacterium]